MNLTKDELEALRRHGFSTKDVFDGTRYSTSEWQRMLETNGQHVAIRKAPCKKGGHRLFDKGNHCLVCSPASPGFISRHTTNGYVYIYGSLKGKLIKVGFTTDLSERYKFIIRESYGGFDDWEQLFFVQFENAGRVESQAHSALADCIAVGSYIKDGKTQNSRELFSCSFSRARDAVLKSSEKKMSEPKTSLRTLLYEF